MDIWTDSVKNVATIILLSYPLTKYSRFRRVFIMSSTSGDRWILSVLFGLLSIVAMMLGAEVFNGASIDSRNTCTTVGGIIAGPLVGFIAGLIGAAYRMYIGNFTALPDALALPLCGLLGGWIHEKYGHRRLKLFRLLLVGLLVGMIHNALVLLLAQPLILAEALISWTGIPDMIVNGVGIAIFVNLLRDIQYSQYAIGTDYAVKAFHIAEQTLYVVAEELDNVVAKKIATIIYKETILDAVAVTDGEKILAFKGVSSDHHLPGDLAISRTINFDKTDEGELLVSRSMECNCPVPNCQLRTLVVVPLICGSVHLGTLEIYKVGDGIHPPDVKLATSIAGLLSMQFVNARAYRQESLLAQAEYEALRAQIQPHFLFNALSAIKVLIRENPVQAQTVLLALAQFLRMSFGTKVDLIPFSEEMKCVELYLTIQRARFGKRLRVVFDIDKEALAILFPPFSVQPLVENAMNHGFADKQKVMNLVVTARVKGHYLEIQVQDDGIGIAKEIVDAVNQNTIIASMGVGLTNINRRLRMLYGDKCEFYIVQEDPGTCVVLRIALLMNEGRGTI